MAQKTNSDFNELKKDIKTVVSKVDKIEQHLLDMNGKVFSLTEHAYNKCPTFRNEIMDNFRAENKIQNRLIFIAMGGILVIGALLTIFIPPIISAALD